MLTPCQNQTPIRIKFIMKIFVFRKKTGIATWDTQAKAKICLGNFSSTEKSTQITLEIHWPFGCFREVVLSDW